MWPQVQVERRYQVFNSFVTSKIYSNITNSLLYGLDDSQNI